MYLSTQKSSSCCGMGAGSPDVLLEAKSHPLVLEVSPDWGRLRLSKMSCGLWSCLRTRLGFCPGVWAVFREWGGERMGDLQSSSVGLPLVALPALVGAVWIVWWSCEMLSAMFDHHGWSWLDVWWRPWVGFLSCHCLLFCTKAGCSSSLSWDCSSPSLDPLFPFVSPTSIVARGGNEAQSFLGHWDQHLPGRHRRPCFTQGWVKTEQSPLLWLSAAPTVSFQTCNLSQELHFTTYFPLWESPLQYAGVSSSVWAAQPAEADLVPNFP